jgi:hypothetical protein
MATLIEVALHCSSSSREGTSVRAWWRVATAAVVLAAAAVSSASSEGPRAWPGAPDDVLTIPMSGVDQVAYVDDTVIVLAGAWVYGYPLARPGTYWEEPVGPSPLGIAVVGGMVLVVTGSPDGSGGGRGTIAMDAQGRVAWRSEGMAFIGEIAGGLVLLGARESDDGLLVKALSAVRLTTGEVVWARDAERVSIARQYNWPWSTVVEWTVDKAGRLELVTREGRTGAELRRRAVSSGDAPQGFDAYVIDGVIVLLEGLRDRIVVEGLSVDGLSAMWSSDITFQMSMIARCASAICLGGPDDGVVVMDPDSGRTDLLYPDLGFYAAVSPTRVAIITRDRTSFVLIDVASRRVLGTWNGWSPKSPVYGWAMQVDHLFLERPASPGSVQVAVVEQTTLRTGVLGTLSGVSDCRPLARWYFSCENDRGGLTVYRTGVPLLTEPVAGR